MIMVYTQLKTDYILPIANSYNCIAESVTSQAVPVTPQAETTVQQPATNAASKRGHLRKNLKLRKHLKGLQNVSSTVGCN